MAIGKIKGPMLFDNLDRQGVNLSFDGNLLYLDVTNRRLGVGTTSPAYGLDVPANVRLANLTITNNTITSNTGKIGLGSIDNITVTGGLPNYIIYTDGAGNLAFGNLNALSLSEGFTGNNIVLGQNALGSLSNALGISTSTSITDGVALLNQLLGTITDSTGSVIHVSGNITTDTNVTAQGNVRANYLLGDGSQLSGVSPPITVTEYYYGDISNVMPHVSTLRFDRATGFTVEDLGSNTALISMASSFKTWIVDGQANLVAFGEDKIKFATDNNIVITTHPTADPLKTITFSLANNLSIVGSFSSGNITATNFSTGNAVITGGYLTGLTNVSATTATFTNLSTGNAVITGGYINNLANVTATTAYFTNLSTGNAVINGGYADNFPIGANVPATGKFTTIVSTNGITSGGNLVAASGTASSSVNTGALVVVGGAGITGNINAGNLITTEVHASTTITNELFVANVFTSSLVATVATLGNMVFANSTITTSDVIVLDTDTALRLPRGGTMARPAGDNGLIRFNTDIQSVEYFDGTIWVPITNTITDQIIDYCDGMTDTFTLDQESTSIGVIVSINGTLQRPATATNPSGAYTVTGDQITFTEVPETTDVIDIRFLGASVTMNSTISDDLIVSGNLTVHGNTNITGFNYGNIVPMSDITYSLGNATRRWKDIYLSGSTIYIGASKISVVDGVLLVDDAPVIGGGGGGYGNAQVAAYLVSHPQPGTYSNANVASYLAVTKPTGTYSNTNVAAYLTGNITSGNVFATSFYYANGTPFVSGTTYSNANVATYLTGNVTAGNVFATGFYYANGTPFVGGGTTSTYSNANVKSYMSHFDGNIIPASNVAYSLGDSTHWWKELWISSNTIYIGGKPLTANPISNVVTYNNQILGGANYTEAIVAPSNPKVGDQWYDTEYDVLYEYLDTGAVNAWVDITGPVGLAGPQGLQGDQGAAGNDGTSVIILGSASTFEELPTWGNLNYGDGFIVQSTGNLAVYDGSVFQDVGQIKGPKGDTGETGATGPQGIQGIQGTPGADATNYLIFGNITANANLNMVTGTLSFTGYNGVVVGIEATTANIGLAGNVVLTSVTSKFAEPVITGNIPSSYTPDWNLGSIHNYTAIQNFTLNAPINMPVGASMTIVVTQDGTGNRAMTSNSYYKFASNIRTLSTGANSVDMMNFVRTGANTYLTVLTKGYA